jgi:hypothetical protein
MLIGTPRSGHFVCLRGAAALDQDESWFEPRVDSKRDATIRHVVLLLFSPVVIVFVIVSPDSILTSRDAARVFSVSRASVSSFGCLELFCGSPQYVVWLPDLD